MAFHPVSDLQRGATGGGLVKIIKALTSATNHQIICERGTAAAHCSLRAWVKCEEQIFTHCVTISGTLTFRRWHKRNYFFPHPSDFPSLTLYYVQAHLHTYIVLVVVCMDSFFQFTMIKKVEAAFVVHILRWRWIRTSLTWGFWEKPFCSSPHGCVQQSWCVPRLNTHDSCTFSSRWCPGTVHLWFTEWYFGVRVCSNLFPLPECETTLRLRRKCNVSQFFFIGKWNKIQHLKLTPAHLLVATAHVTRPIMTLGSVWHLSHAANYTTRRHRLG